MKSLYRWLSPLVAWFLMASPTPAGLVTWTGGTSDFELASNWSENVAPVNDLDTDTAVFEAVGVSNQPTLTASRQLFGMQFNAAGWVLAGGGYQLELGAGGIQSSGAGTNEVGADLVLRAAQTWSVDADHELHVTGTISGDSQFALTKAGSGTLVLSGANGYGGGTHITAGTVKAGAANVLPSNGNVYLDSTATPAILDLAGFDETIAGLFGQEGTLGTVVSNGLAQANLTLGGNNGSSRFYGNINDGTGKLGLIITGTGRTAIYGTNTFSGGLFIRGGGTVRTDSGSSLGVAGGNLTFDNGGGTLEVGTVNMSRRYNIDADATISVATGMTSSFTGNLVGSGNLTKSGDGDLVFLTSTPNFTGNLILGYGGLDAGNAYATTRLLAMVHTSQPTGSLDGVQSITILAGSELRIDQSRNGALNGVNYINDTADINMRGGSFFYYGRYGTATSEQVGDLTFQQGVSLVTSSHVTSAGTANLTFSSLTADAGTVAFFAGNGSLGGNSKVFITAQANGFLGGQFFAVPASTRQDFLKYDSVNGVQPLADGDYSIITTGTESGWDGQNVKVQQVSGAWSLSFTTNHTINSLNMHGPNATTQALTIGAGHNLNITSGGINIGGNYATSSQNYNLTLGNLTSSFGNLTFYINTNRVLYLSSNIVDNAGTMVNLTKAGPGTLNFNQTVANSYTGNTYILGGTVNTLLANRAFFGSGQVFVNDAVLLLQGTGGTTWAGTGTNSDYQVLNAGQLWLNQNMTAADSFYVDGNSTIQAVRTVLQNLSWSGNPVAGTGQLSFEPGAIITHMTALGTTAADADPNQYSVKNLPTNATLYYGLGAEQATAAAVLNIGDGTPWMGVSTNRGGYKWRLGTINIVNNSDTIDVYLRGLAIPTTYPTTGSNVSLTLGRSSDPTGPSITLSNPGTANVNIVGTVTANHSVMTFGDPDTNRFVVFQVTPGGYFDLTQATALGSGTKVANVIVQSGGTLRAGNAAAINGNVVVRPDGRLIANAAAGLTGTGQLEFRSGAVIHIGQPLGFTGSQALASLGRNDTVVRLTANVGDANNRVLGDGTIFNGEPVFELFQNVRPADPTGNNGAVLLLNSSAPGKGMLTNDYNDRVWYATATATASWIDIDSVNGGTIAATTGTYIQVTEDVHLNGATLYAGYDGSVDGFEKLGQIQLSDPDGTSGGAIQVAGGAELMASAAWVVAKTQNVSLSLGDGSRFDANYAVTLRNITGSGNLVGDSVITVGDSSDFAFSGVVGNATNPALRNTVALTKVGSGTMTLGQTAVATGATIIGAGTIQLGADNALSTVGALTLGSTGNFGVLKLNGFNQEARNLVTAGLNGTIVNGNSTLATLTINSQAATTFNGLLGNATAGDDNNFALVKKGSATLTLNGQNYYTGSTSIEDGTLKIDRLGALGNPTGADATIHIGTATTTGTLEFAGTAPATLSRDFELLGSAGLIATAAVGGNALTYNGSVTNNANGDMTFTFGGTNTDDNTFASALSNPSGGTLTVVKNGTGKWILRSGALPTGANLAVSIGTLNLGAQSYDLATVTFNGGSLLGSGTLTSTQDWIISSGNVSVVLGDGALGEVRSLLKNTSGTASLLGLNTYSGQTTIEQGKLIVNTIANVSGGGSSLGAPTSAANGTIVMGNASVGSTLQFEGTAANVTDRNLSLAFTAGTLSANGTAGSTLTWNGTIDSTNTGDVILTLDGNNSDFNSITGQIGKGSANSLGIQKLGAGRWILDNAGNSFDGSINVQNGILGFTSDAALGTGTGTITLGDTASLGTLEYAGSDPYTFTRSLTLTGWGGGIGSSGTGNVTVSSDVFTRTTAGNLVLDGTSSGDNLVNIVLNDTLGGGSGGLNLVKRGAGTWILGQANTYSGTTTVAGGTLRVGAAGAIPTGNLTTVAAGTLDYHGVSDNVGNLTLGGITGSSANVTLGGATLTMVNTNVNYAANGLSAVISGGTVDLGATARNFNVAHTANATVDLEIAANLTGTTGFTKFGTGVLLLNNAANDFSGNVTIIAGTVQFVTPSALGGGANVNIASATSVLEYVGSGDTLTKNLFFTGNGTLAASGSGPLTFDGSVAFDVVRTVNLAGTGHGYLNLNLTAYDLNKLGTGTWTLNSQQTVSHYMYVGNAYAQPAGTFGVLQANTTYALGNSRLYIRGGAIVELNAQGASANTVYLQGGQLDVNVENAWNDFGGYLGGNRLPASIAGVSGGGVLNLNQYSWYTTGLTFDTGGNPTAHAGDINGNLTNPGTLYLLGGIAVTATNTTQVVEGNINAGVNVLLTSNSAQTRTVTTNHANTIVNIWGNVTETPGYVATVQKLGSGTLRLGGNNTYSGATYANAGTLILDYSRDTNSKLSDTAELRIAGATVQLVGNATADVTESVGSANITGRAEIDLTPAAGHALNMNLNSISRNAGGALRINYDDSSGGTGRVTTDNQNVNGILGGWLTVVDSTGYNWGYNADNTQDGRILSFTAYNSTFDAGDNTDVTAGVHNLSSGTFAANSLRFNDAAGNATVTLPAGTSLLASGGVLVTPNVGAHDVTIDGGNLTVAGDYPYELFLLQDNPDGRLLLGTAIVNNGGANVTLSKHGAGTVVLNGQSTYSGATNITNGTLQLGVNQALPSATTVMLGDSDSVGILKLDGHSQMLAGIGINANALATPLLNTIVNDNATSGTLIIDNPAAVTYSGSLGGSTADENRFSLVKTGIGTLTINSVNSFTGTTTVLGGNLSLNYNTYSGDKVASGNKVILGGGTLAFTVSSLNANWTQNISGVDVIGGGSTVQLIGNTTANTFQNVTTTANGGTLTRCATATVNFQLSGNATSTRSYHLIADDGRVGTDGEHLLGGWATYSAYNVANDPNATWAALAANRDVIAASAMSNATIITYFSGVNKWVGNLSAGTNLDEDPGSLLGYNGVLGDNLTINSLRFSKNYAGNTTAGYVNLGSYTLTLNSGGLLSANNGNANQEKRIGNGTLTSGYVNQLGTGELFIQQFSKGSLFINAVIADNGATPLNVIRAGAGTGPVHLNALNTYSGDTYLQQGETRFYNLDNTGVAGSFGTGGTIHAGSVGTVGLYYYGTTPVITNRTLDLYGGIVSLANNNTTATTVLTWDGSITSSTIGSKILQLYSSAGAGVNVISGPISDGVAGSYVSVRSMTGNWSLSGTNTYTGYTEVNGGILHVGANNLLSNTSNVLVSGSGILDVGDYDQTLVSPLTMGGVAGNPSVVLNNGSLRLANDVIFNAAGNPTATIISTGTGTIDLGSATRTFVIGDSTAPADLTVAVPIVGSAGAGLVKAGAGTMVLSANNTYAGPTSVTGGTLTVATALNGSTALSVTGSGSLLTVSGGFANAGAMTSITVGNGAALSLLDGAGNKLDGLTSLSVGSVAGTNSTFKLNVGDLYATGDQLTTDLLTLLGGGALNLYAGNKVTFDLTDAGMNENTEYDLLKSLSGGLTTGVLANTDWVLGDKPGGFTSISLFANDTTVYVQTGNLILGSLYWTGNVTATPNSQWNASTDNWAGDKIASIAANTLPGAGTDVHFVADNSTTGGTAVNTTLEQNFKLNSLTFEPSTDPLNTPANVTIASGTGINRLEIASQNPADGITIAAGGPANVTITAGVKIGRDQTWTVADDTAILTLGSLFGSANVTKAGAGKVILGTPADATFNSTDTATVMVNAGTLDMRNVGALGTTANDNLAAVVVNGGAFFFNNATSSNVANALTLNGGTLSAGGATQIYSNLAAITAPSFINMRDGNSVLMNATARSITLNSTFSGTGSLTVDSCNTLSGGNQYSGTLTLGGANNGWSGGLNLLRGTVTVTDANALGTGAITASAGRIIFNAPDGTTFNLAQNITVDAPGGLLEIQADNSAATPAADMTVNLGGVITLGSAANANNALRVLPQTDNFSVVNITNSIVLGNNASISVSGSSARPVNVTGVISESGGSYMLSINDDQGGWGATDQVLSLQSNNTYSGGTRLDAGILEVGKKYALGTGSTLLVSNLASLRGSVDLVGDNALPYNLVLDAALTTTGNYSLQINGTTTNAAGNRSLTNSIALPAGLTLSGQVNLSDDATARALTIAGAGNTVIDGQVVNGNGSTGGNLTYTGTGNLTLNNSANSYTGITTLNTATGRLNLAGNQVLSSSTLKATAGYLVPLVDMSAAAGPLTNALILNGALGLAGTNNITFTGATTAAIDTTITNNLTGGAQVVFASQIVAGPSLTFMSLNATDLGAVGSITGGISISNGNAADLNVNSGTWYLSGPTSIADDLIVTGNNTLLVFNAGDFITADPNSNNTGAGLYLRNGATVRLTADEPYHSGLDYILNDQGNVTLDTAGYTITTPRLDLGSQRFSGNNSLIEGATGTVNVTTSMNLYGGTINAKLAGAGAIVKYGPGTVTLKGDNSGLTGNTTTRIDEGMLALDYTAFNTDKISANTGLDLRGGTLLINGSASAPTVQTVRNVTLASGGASRMTINAGSGQTAVLNLGPLTRAAGAGTLRIDLPAGPQDATNGATTTTAANATFGTWGNGGFATVTDSAGTWFATTSGTGTYNVVPLASVAKDDVSTWAPGDHVTDGSGLTGNLASSLSINTLRFNAASGSLLNLDAAANLTVASGGILVTNAVTSGTPGIYGGRLSTGVAELIVTQDSAQTFAISTAIGDGESLTKTGTGTLLLSGNNNYTGRTQIFQGTLQAGGTGIGDFSRVTLANTNPSMLQLVGDETIGYLDGGSATVGSEYGVVDVGGRVLTVNDSDLDAIAAETLTYAGVITGTGTLVKKGNDSMALTGISTFSGTVVINDGRIDIAGLGTLKNASAITLNGPTELLIRQDQSGNVDRIGDDTSMTLNNTAGVGTTFTTQFGLRPYTSDNHAHAENIGAIVLGAGYNTITSQTTVAKISTLTADILTRNNHATALVRGTALGNATATQEGLITFDSINQTIIESYEVGGDGAAGTTTVSIIPWLVGDVTDAGAGNSFVTNADATKGLRPLDAAEYVTDEAPYNTLTGATWNNVRFATNPSANLTGSASAINSLVLDAAANLTINGPHSALAINSGAILSAQAYQNVIGNYTSLTTGGGRDYSLYVTDPAGSLTIESKLGSAVPLVKSGAGTLILTNATNAFTDLYFNLGAVQADAMNKLGTGSWYFYGGAFRWASGASFDPFAGKTVYFGTGDAWFDTNGNTESIPTSITGGGGSGGLGKLGAGTLTLSGTNSYAGTTTVSGGVLRLDSANALPGGIGVSGGTSGLTLAGGVLGLGNGNFSRSVGTGADQVQWTGNGGFAAYGADRVVNLGGAGDVVAWGTSGLAPTGFLPAGSNLILGAADATNTVTFVNPINLGTAARTVQVDDGSAVVDAELAGTLIGTGAFTKTGSGLLLLSGTQTYTNTPVTVSHGVLQVGGAIDGVATTTIGNTGTSVAAVDVPTGGNLTTTVLTVGTTAGGVGVLNVRGGNVNTLVGNANSFGGNGYGGLFVSGGSFTGNRIGTYNYDAATAYSVTQISGGSVTSNEWVILANNRTEVTVTGGTLLHNAASQNIGIAYSKNSVGVFNMAGGLVDNTGRNVSFFEKTALTVVNTSGTLNLDGGTLVTNTIVGNATATMGTSTVNFGGGTLTAAIDTANLIATSVSNVYVNGNFGSFAGGAVIDTNGHTVTIAKDLSAPTGNGVTGVTLSSNGTGYVGAPYVEINGDGTGATGYAVVDNDPNSPTYGQVTSVVITNPGQNYTTATINLLGGGGSGASVAAVTGLNTSGGLTKQGLGTLTLSGASLDYAGTTTVTAGTLNITGGGTSLATTGVNVGDSGTLNFTNTTASLASISSVTVAGGGTLNFFNGQGQSLALSTLNLGAGSGTATLGLELGTAASDRLDATDAASLANTVNFNIQALSDFGVGTYTLLTGAANSHFDAANITFTVLPAGYKYSKSATDTELDLVVSPLDAGVSTLYWKGGLLDGKWTTYNTNLESNWASAADGSANAHTTPSAGMAVVFSTSGQSLAGPLNTTLETPTTIDSLVFNNQTGSGPITAISIAPGAAGSLTITSSGTAIDVNSGAPPVTISAPLILGASQTWNVANGGSLAVTSIVSGSGLGITKTGGGTLALSAVNTFTGPVVLNGGTLQANGSAQALGTGAATLTLTSGTLDFNNNAGLNFGRNTIVNGDAAIVSENSAAASGVTYTLGTLNIDGHQLTVSGGNVNGGVAGLTFGATTLSGSPTIVINDPAAGGSTLLTLGAITGGSNLLTVSGNGDMAQTGAWSGVAGSGLTLDAGFTGNVTLNQANTFTGKVIVNGGRVIATVNGSLGGGTAADTLTLNGGTLEIMAGSARTISRNTTVTADSWITVGRNASSTGSGVTHTLGRLAIGPQTLTVATNGTYVTGGTSGLTFGNTTFTGAPSFNIVNAAGSTTLLTLANVTNGGNTATIQGNGSLTASGAWNGTGGITLGSNFTGTLTFGNSGANGFSGGLVVKSGSVTTGSTGTNFGAGTIQLGDTAANANDVRLSGALSSGNIANAIVLNSDTTGTISLESLNNTTPFTYSGGITGANNLTVKSGSTAAATLLFTTNALNFAGTLTNAGSGPGATIITAPITGVTGITQNSATSNLLINGSVANTSTGTVTVSAGNLTLDKTGVTAVAGPITLGSAGNGLAEILLLNQSNQIADTSVITFLGAAASGDAGVLVLNGKTETVGGLVSATDDYGVVVNNNNTNGSLTVSAAAGANQVFMGRILDTDSAYTGSLQLIKAGAGNLTLTSLNNLYGGGTVIQDGRLIVAADAVLGKGSVGVVFAGAAGANPTLAASDSFATARTFNLGANGGTLEVAAGKTLTVNGPLSGGSLTKTGSGDLSLQNTGNSYSGPTTIVSGRVLAASDAVFGNSAALIFAAGGGNPTLAATASFLTARDFHIDAAGTIDVATNESLQIAGTLSGSGSLTKSGFGALVLGGSSSGFTGDLNVAAGGVGLNGSLGSTNVNVGTSGNTAPEVLALTADAVLSSAVVNLAGGTVADDAGALVLNGHNATVKGLAGAGIVSNSYDLVSLSPAASAVLTVDTAGTDSTFSGVIADNRSGDVTSQALSLVKTGTGNLTLAGSAANSYRGPTTVSGGNLILNKDDGVNALAGDLSVTAGAAVRWLASNQVVDTARVDLNGGTAYMQAGTWDLVGHLVTSNGGLVAGPGVLATATSASFTGGTTEVANGGTLGGDAAISGSGSKLTVNGTVTGRVTASDGATLGGNGTIGGGILLDGGTLAPGNSPGTITTTGDFSATSNGGTLAIETGLSGSSVLADQLLVVGAHNVDLHNVSLLLTWESGTAAADQYLAIIDNQEAASTLNGYFAGMDPSGGSVALGEHYGSNWYLYYNVDAEGHNLLADSGNDVVITNVPEPSTLAALAGMGLLGCGYAWLRRKKRAARKGHHHGACTSCSAADDDAVYLDEYLDPACSDLVLLACRTPPRARPLG